MLYEKDIKWRTASFIYTTFNPPQTIIQLAITPNQPNMRASLLTALLSSLPAAFSAPQSPKITNTTALPLRFGVLLYPGFVALDAYSVVDILSKLQQPNQNATTSSLVDTLHLKYSLPATFDVIAANKTPVPTIPTISNSTFGQAIVVTATFEEYMTSDKQLDVLIVPGGYNSRSAYATAGPFIKAVYPRVCLLNPSPYLRLIL